ncbi:MAG: carboxymuconolactone decarboxylase family protein [Verrucomicrobiota bacterium JB022]|nr:carboxymuconolactone decarboxylase family protein [Verrucomicrobiota bacterium JB022]
MEPRLDYFPFAQPALKAQMSIEGYLKQSSLGHKLLELVKLRVSQINGCAFCVNMHINLLREAGVPTEKIDLLVVWRESPVYTARERAAFEWAESVTLLADTGVPDATYEEVAEHFDDAELVDLTWNIASINSWNRLSVSFRKLPEIKQAAVRA